MWRKRREEKRDYLNLTWLNYQYYELGRSLQDIADDQGVSMMTINKWVDKIEEPGSVKTEEKSINACPHCGQRLYAEAIFCSMCGKKVEEDQVIPSISEWKEKLKPKIPDLKVEKIQLVPDIIEEKTIAEIPPIKHEEVLTRKKTEKKKQKFCPNCNALVGRYSEICKHCGYELIKRCHICGDYLSHNKQHICKELKGIVFKEEKEERQVTEESLTGTEENQPVPPILNKKVDILEKLKVIPYICKFCRMELNKKATFCPQCGTRVKKK